MMLDNTTYNKVKTLATLSQLCWFIEKHALVDAQQAGDAACIEALENINKDLKKHIEQLQGSLCIISQ